MTGNGYIYNAPMMYRDQFEHKRGPLVGDFLGMV